MDITFCGAAGTVTGSCHLITLDDGRKILLDCGLYQGYDLDLENFNETWKFDPKDIDYLIISHAHIDHTGRIPKLVKDGFEGPIVCTYATRDLCNIMLLDSAYIQEKDAEYKNKRESRKKSNKKHKPLYRVKDAENCMNQYVAIGYGEWFDVGPGIKLLFRDSGHILGSASVTLKIQTEDGLKSIGFTGDIGRPERPILRDPEPMPHVDYMICESTYGGKQHPAPPQEKEGLLDIIEQTCVTNKGRLIIPAFSVGRTQELVYMMDQLVNEGKLPNIPVYVDSPLAVNATDIFKTHPECYDHSILEYIMTDADPFGWSKLRYVRKVEDSKAINDHKGPCIIISASGMITAGRILHHVRNNIEDQRNCILIVGYCAEGSIGAQLATGAEKIKIFGQEHKVKCEIKRMHSFSAHGDQNEMIDFLDNQSREKLEKIFLVHGVEARQKVFAEELSKAGFKDIVIPKTRPIIRSMTISEPLKGLKVVETANVLAGPSVGMFLAELGAEVIKVENREAGGDMTRSWKLSSEDPSSPVSAYFSSVNYGKQYLSKDLKNESDRNEVISMIDRADIFINNMKASSAKKFNLDYASLSKRNPKLIHAELSGFAGESRKVGFDIVLQAETGYLSMTGDPKDPSKLPVALIDIIAAHQMKEGVLLALFMRERDGKGAHIQCSLEEASLSSLANQATNYLMQSHVASRMGTLHPNIAPYGEMVKTNEGIEFVLAIGTDLQFRKLCTILGLEELSSDSRFESNRQRVIHRSDLDLILRNAALKMNGDALESSCDEAKVPIGRIKKLDEVLNSKVAKEMILEEEIEGTLTKRLKTVTFHIER